MNNHVQYYCKENGRYIESCDSRTVRGTCFCQRAKFVRGALCTVRRVPSATEVIAISRRVISAIHASNYSLARSIKSDVQKSLVSAAPQSRALAKRRVSKFARQ